MNAALPEPNLGHNLTVTLNAISAVLLLLGYGAARYGHVVRHKRLMIGALVSSALFLAVYLWNHRVHGSTHYPFRDWTYRFYLLVLIPHIMLAAGMVPFIVKGVWLAGRERFQRHARLMRKVWPVWMYVSVSGVLIYLMLCVLPQWRG